MGGWVGYDSKESQEIIIGEEKRREEKRREEKRREEKRREEIVITKWMKKINMSIKI